jgi:predicted PurR-regulated permease PerM
MNRTIEISSGTILRTVFILLLLWFIYLVRDIIALVFVAIIITSAIDPIVDWFQKRKVPRAFTVLVVYILFLSILGAAVGLLIPPLSTEIRGLGENFPVLAEKLSGYFRIVREYADSHNLQQQVVNFTGSAAEKISQAGSSILGGTVSFIGGIFSFVVVLSIAFYMSVQEKGIKKFIASFAPDEHSGYISGLVDRIQFKMGRWLQGQMFLMLIIFALDYLGLLLIGAPYALVLALIAGILEIIPYIGPIVSAIIAVSISFLHDPVTGLLVLALFVLVQQLEGYVLTPLVMKRAVGLNPVVVILALMIGAKLGGVLGIIIAVPIATAFSEIVNDLTKEKEVDVKSGRSE